MTAERIGAGVDEPSRWTAAHVAAIADAPLPAIPLIEAAHATPIIPGIDVWDAWPLQMPDGSTARFGGTEYWMMLSAAAGPDPLQRHDSARIRLVAHADGRWEDRGLLLPEGFTPGAREWAGSAIYHPERGSVALYYTVTGRSDEDFSFEQRMFATEAPFDAGRFGTWERPHEFVTTDGDCYVDTRTTQGGPGMIKGFRDPAWFRDPADGAEYVTFAGSDGRSAHVHNGVAGIARRDGPGWTLLPPVVSADGLNNELERPHLVALDGLYYLFWSTQRHVFAPGPAGPNGLYGAVAEQVLGPYRPLNGTGLVAANPAAEPTQSYSWLVLGASLEVASFVDYWGMAGRTLAEAPELARAQFGGTPAPRFRIGLDGARSWIMGPADNR